MSFASAHSLLPSTLENEMKYPRLYTSHQSSGNVEPKEQHDLLKEVEKRGMLVIQSAISIEREMEQLVCQFYHPNDPYRFVLFKDLVIGTKYLSFDAKRHISMEILRIAGNEKREIKKLDDALRKVGHYRNAFAHGKVDIKKDEPFLKWFKTKQEVHLIDDNLLGYLNN